MSVTLEICVESATDVGPAVAAGASRIELCADLALGGTTPSSGSLRAARAATRAPIVALVRPRGGDFVYDAGELAVMAADVEVVHACGLDGVAVGCLTADGHVDRAATAALVRAARPLPVTFHRAFDRVPERDAALDQLVELGVARVLTAGGAASAAAGRDELRRLARRAAGRIEIVAAGGVRAEHARALVATGVPALHASCARPRPGRAGDLGPGGAAAPGAWSVDVDAVRALARSLAEG